MYSLTVLWEDPCLLQYAPKSQAGLPKHAYMTTSKAESLLNLH